MGNSDRETMEVVFSTWFNDKKKFLNSMQTTADVEFKEGYAQVKWWKFKGCIIIKIINLHVISRQRNIHQGLQRDARLARCEKRAHGKCDWKGFNRETQNDGLETGLSKLA